MVVTNAKIHLSHYTVLITLAPFEINLNVRLNISKINLICV